MSPLDSLDSAWYTRQSFRVKEGEMLHAHLLLSFHTIAVIPCYFIICSRSEAEKTVWHHMLYFVWEIRHRTKKTFLQRKFPICRCSLNFLRTQTLLPGLSCQHCSVLTQLLGEGSEHFQGKKCKYPRIVCPFLVIALAAQPKQIPSIPPLSCKCRNLSQI